LGIAAFLEGDSASALSLTAEALTGAKASHDIGAQVRYMSLVGRALIQFGRHESALEYFDRAIALATGTEGAGFPYIAYVGKGEALLCNGSEFSPL